MGIQSKEGYHPAAAQRHLANVERHMPKDGQASFGSMRSCFHLIIFTLAGWLRKSDTD